MSLRHSGLCGAIWADDLQSTKILRCKKRSICYAEFPQINNKECVVKNLRRLFSLAFVSVLMTTAKAEPVMNLITVNTNDGAGYAAWAKASASALVKANNAMAMGLCTPTSGAEMMGDLYLWSFFDSQETVYNNEPMNPAVQAEVAKMKVDRTVREWDIWRIVRAAEVSERGYYYNLRVKTDNMSGYLQGLDAMYAEMQKREMGVTMQVFVGDTGVNTGIVMVSLGSSDGAALGRALDARTESWFADTLSKFEGQRELEHGFSLICETYAAAEQ